MSTLFNEKSGTHRALNCPNEVCRPKPSIRETLQKACTF